MRYHLRRYEAFSGAKINDSKSELLTLDGATTEIRTEFMHEEQGNRDLGEKQEQEPGQEQEPEPDREPRQEQEERVTHDDQGEQDKYEDEDNQGQREQQDKRERRDTDRTSEDTHQPSGDAHQHGAKEEEELMTSTDTLTWRAFERCWCSNPWGRKWWIMESQIPRLTQRYKGPLSDFVREAAITIQKYKISASDVQRFSTATPGELYWTLLRHLKLQPYDKGRSLKETLSPYLRHQVFPIPTFTDKLIPFMLRDIQWRSYHQILHVGTKAKGATGSNTADHYCHRPSCIDKDTPETVEHAVKSCVPARRLWLTVARVFQWPYLATQDWETIVSGLQPAAAQEDSTGSTGTPGTSWRDLRRTKPQDSKPPWSVVRLINLIVIHTIFRDRRSESYSKKPTRTIESNKLIILHCELEKKEEMKAHEREEGQQQQQEGESEEQMEEGDDGSEEKMEEGRDDNREEEGNRRKERRRKRREQRREDRKEERNEGIAEKTREGIKGGVDDTSNANGNKESAEQYRYDPPFKLDKSVEDNR
ncbi:UNVERIFIED_CONTAM: hypothetical protein K2H54_001465 [Gekko kuhli]